jgi:hypothetical protein
MLTTKRYTNQTFTKHVDDEKGRHRPLRSLPEPAVCKICGDVFANRRWSKPTVTTAKIKSASKPQSQAASQVVCPGCERQRNGVPIGFVYLQGQFLTAHRDEITRLLEREAERAAEDNPLARIMAWQTEPSGQIIVTTTTEHLAQRLGQALNKAYCGKTRYGFSHRNKLARVWWQRD